MRLRADHKLHFCYGFIIAVLGLFAAGFVTNNIWHSLLFGFGCSVLAGLSKEIYDRLRPYGTRKFDKVDWLVTVLGGLSFVAIVAFLNWIG